MEKKQLEPVPRVNSNDAERVTNIPLYNDMDFYSCDPRWLRHGGTNPSALNVPIWMGEGRAMSLTPTTSSSGRRMTSKKYRNQTVDGNLYHGHQGNWWVGEHALHQDDRFPYASTSNIENQLHNLCSTKY